MTWSPGRTVIEWKDVKTVSFGLSIAAPHIAIVCIAKKNGKKITIPVHGMSQCNTQAIAQEFA